MIVLRPLFALKVKVDLEQCMDTWVLVNQVSKEMSLNLGRHTTHHVGEKWLKC